MATVISPRIGDDVAAALADIAGTKAAGGGEACEAYVYIRRSTMAELQGKFSKAEATALVDMYNGTMLTPELQYQAQVLRVKIEDAEKFDRTCSKYKVDVSKLTAKTDKLTAAQVFILQQELVRAWNQNAGGSEAISDLISFLSK